MIRARRTTTPRGSRLDQQRDRDKGERQSAAARGPRLVAPRHRVDGPDPEPRSAGVARSGDTGEPRTSAAIRGVGRPATPEPPAPARTGIPTITTRVPADRVQEESHQRRHGEQDLDGGVRRHAQSSRSSSCPQCRGLATARWSLHHPGRVLLSCLRRLSRRRRGPRSDDQRRAPSDSRSGARHVHRHFARLPLRAARWSASHPWRAIGAWFAFVAVAISLAAVVQTQPTARTTGSGLGPGGRDDLGRPVPTTRSRASWSRLRGTGARRHGRPRRPADGAMPVG